MSGKSVKPRTNLIIDLSLFSLLTIVVISTLIEHTTPSRGTHLGFMLHRIHGVAGIAMSLAVGLHLYFHLPWVIAQLRRIFQSQSQ